MPPFQSDSLPPFPPIRPGYPAGEGALRLRPAGAEDMSFLRRLSDGFQRDLLRVLFLSEIALWPVLAEQFDRHHRYFVAHLPEGDFLVIEQAGRPVGRLYLDRRPDVFHIAEFDILPENRNAGLGSAVLGIVQAAARMAGMAAVTLNVDRYNLPAQRLYRRHGFVPGRIHGALLAMSWPAGEGAAPPRG